MADLHWYKIEEEIPEGDFIRQVVVAGKKLCLLRHDGIIHLVQNTCPHAGGILSGGWCKEGMLICPIHRYSYHLENGRGAAGQGDYINIYPVRVENDGVYAGFRKSLFSRFFG
ncbi:Rieske 2Fe-2S domain-containing protein [Pedobacter sp. MC2016-15]|uniref:Rieske (2Fe-2S) protein n=1 Tax=Pedobacter sp. MC2016-15 TaxID=2994473 RepID=UPI0022480DF7|nr:Rieske 2Fe-2S domain-containing protein [Pedobacter sp. MC2016-15]MCX2477576.1 Rieske 2Fe-2S domain-containing protein [Pedobacter sp. MC2016-15]